MLTLLVAGCGDGAGEAGSATSGDDFQFEAGDAEHWAKVWCDVDGSMTREDAIELMGQPSREFDASDGQPQSQWDTGSFGYTLFYDNTGHIEQAYVNELELSNADKPFSCALVRFF
jgi:hypothetical protein